MAQQIVSKMAGIIVLVAAISASVSSEPHTISSSELIRKPLGRAAIAHRAGPVLGM